MLVAGMLTVHKTTGQIIIRVDNHIIPKTEWAHTLWRETSHLLRMAGNFSQDKDDVERYAAILAAACHEIVEWVGLSPENVRPLATGESDAGRSQEPS